MNAAQKANEERMKREEAAREEERKKIAALPDWKSQQELILAGMSRCTAALVQQVGDIHGKPIDEETMQRIRSTVDRLDMYRQEYDRLAELNDKTLLSTARRMFGK
jgi:hypothetical protein